MGRKARDISNQRPPAEWQDHAPRDAGGMATDTVMIEMIEHAIDALNPAKIRLPKEIGATTFTVGNAAYTVLRYTQNEAPSLRQSTAIAVDRGEEMLTLDEAREIRDNAGLRAAFTRKGALFPGEWSYVHDQGTKEMSGAAFLSRPTIRKGALFIGRDISSYGAPVVVLKHEPPKEKDHSGTDNTIQKAHDGGLRTILRDAWKTAPQRRQ